MYDRIGPKAPFVIRISLYLASIYAMSPKLQTAVFAENALEARLLLTLFRPEELQNHYLVTTPALGRRNYEKARQRKNY